MICTKSFFGSKTLPHIELTKELLEKLAEESVNKSLTVTGVQKKLSVHLSEETTPRITLIGHPLGYILKPSSDEYDSLPEAEDMVMDIADIMGIKTVPHGLLPSNGAYYYITKRIDRVMYDNVPRSLAMEDFCQLSGRQTEDKYKSSYERCAAIIKKYSSRPGIDISEFFLRLVVCFLTGNSDMHLKNFSLIETSPGNRNFVLSPAYDLLPVNILLPEDKDETALTLCGKRSNIDRTDFLKFAKECEIQEQAAAKMIDSCLRKKDKAIEICNASKINDALKNDFIQLINQRTDRLK